jgi:hypothetical protein
MNDLVQRLTVDQPVIASLRPEPTLEAFKAAVDRGYVHVLFTETRGGTELGVRIDPAWSDLSQADFEHGTGTAKVGGELVLDYVRVRCHAAIDLATLRGTGRLEPLGDEEPGADESGEIGEAGEPAAGPSGATA